MSSSTIHSLEDPAEEHIQQEKIKQVKSPSPSRGKLDKFLRKELEFLGVTQTMIGLICCFFGGVNEFILNFLKPDHTFSTFHLGYPIWGGLLFTISGSLLIASERKGTKYLAQSSLVMAILSAVVAGIGISILCSNLEETSSVMEECHDLPFEDFCFAATFLNETAVMVLFLTVLELGIGILLPVNEIIGKIVETWFAKHPKAHQEALYEELSIYYPIPENIELQKRELISGEPKDTGTESMESLHSRLYQSPEEL
ncbi:high affinity immunoglobulin epsilon receptor subunit beta-like [Dromiciops gliroides]|uniref:high affinity immunoglobulin epsilon receptor subunit beta-like n=1 Tax=Dromiciops gliroides TaxID=33562 RepID=UPI001CC80976|nr:high affinity immunoglobulin epsilon receptor subunit beta-like [Dromiciops gliroides]